MRKHKEKCYGSRLVVQRQTVLLLKTNEIVGYYPLSNP